MKTIGAKVSNELYDKVKKVAKDNEITVSTLLKQSFQNATIKNTKFEQKILFEINRIGNNLNQVARHSNIHKTLDRQVLNTLLRIEADLKKVLNK